MTRTFAEPGKLIMAILLRDEPAVADTGTTLDPIYHIGDPTEPPVDLVDRLPYVWVTQGPGRRDEITDLTFVDITVFADASTDEGVDLAERIADQHIKRRRAAVGYGVLDEVRVSIRPQSVPWGDTNVSRHLVQVQVSARRTGG